MCPAPLFYPQALSELRGKTEDIPCIIGGQEVRTGKTRDQLCVSSDGFLCEESHTHEVSRSIMKYLVSVLHSHTTTSRWLRSSTSPEKRKSSRPSTAPCRRARNGKVHRLKIGMEQSNVLVHMWTPNLRPVQLRTTGSE